MKVFKFGGSSVGTADAIDKVIAIVTESIKKEPTITYRIWLVIDSSCTRFSGDA